MSQYQFSLTCSTGQMQAKQNISMLLCVCTLTNTNGYVEKKIA